MTLDQDIEKYIKLTKKYLRKKEYHKVSDYFINVEVYYIQKNKEMPEEVKKLKEKVYTSITSKNLNKIKKYLRKKKYHKAVQIFSETNSFYVGRGLELPEELNSIKKEVYYKGYIDRLDAGKKYFNKKKYEKASVALLFSRMYAHEIGIKETPEVDILYKKINQIKYKEYINKAIEHLNLTSSYFIKAEKYRKNLDNEKLPIRIDEIKEHLK